MIIKNQVGADYYTPYNVSIDPSQVQSSLNGEDVALIGPEDNGRNWKFYLGVTLFVLGVIGILGFALSPIVMPITIGFALAFSIHVGGAMFSSAVMTVGGVMLLHEKALPKSDQPPSYAQTLLSPPDYNTPSYGLGTASVAQPYYDPNDAPPAYIA